MSGRVRQTRDAGEPLRLLAAQCAMLVKEFIQLRRDRVTFAMMVMIPVMQLLLFGYAINTTPRHLPTAVLLQEDPRRRPLDPQGDGEHRLFPLHPQGARRGRVRRC